MRRTKPSARVILSAYAMILIGIVCLVFAWLLHSRQQIMPAVKSVDVISAPSSVKPANTAIVNYQVAPTLPKYIALPTISIGNTRVVRLGLSKNGSIATPDNIYDTGWYQDSAKPGEPGAMFLYGHVSSWTAQGVFYNLKKLKPGDAVKVTRGDDKIYSYQVISTKTYPSDNVDMQTVLAPIDPNTPGLNLMTCTGQVIKGTNDFSERLVVFTSLVNN